MIFGNDGPTRHSFVPLTYCDVKRGGELSAGGSHNAPARFRIPVVDRSGAGYSRADRYSADRLNAVFRNTRGPVTAGKIACGSPGEAMHYVEAQHEIMDLGKAGSLTLAVETFGVAGVNACMSANALSVSRRYERGRSSGIPEECRS